MKKASKPIIGILSRKFDWNSLSPDNWQRIFLRNHPDDAYARIRQLEDWNSQLSDIAKRQGAMLEAVQRHLQSSKRLSSAEYTALKKTHDTETQRLAGLNQKAASEENKRRAEDFITALTQYVLGRVKHDPLVLAKAVADDVRAGTGFNNEWARKNKHGHKYSLEYLKRLIGPILKTAKTEYKARRL